jgi:hypothetical protein
VYNPISLVTGSFFNANYYYAVYALVNVFRLALPKPVYNIGLRVPVNPMVGILFGINYTH